MNSSIAKKAGLMGLFLMIVAGLWAVDVTITPPRLILTGVFDQLAAAGFTTDIDTQMQELADDFETQIMEDETITKYSKQPDLATAFANAGSAAAQLGTLKSAQDFKLFSVALGTGMAFSVPEIDFFSELDSADFIEDEGDVYAGMAVHPFNLSAGLNLGFLVDGLRATVKFGYFSLAEGDMAEGMSFEALSIGAGVSYMLIKPKAIPLGIVRWRGLSVGSGIFYQRNTIDMEITPDESGYRSAALTFADLGYTTSNPVLDGYSYGPSTEIGTITTTPTVTGTIESSTVTIPLAVSTGVRLLYVLDLSVGAGCDIVFGSSEIALKATQEVDFEVSQAMKSSVTVEQPGSAKLSNSTEESPQIFRPHLMVAAGLSMGPVRLEVPFTYYFDSEGNTYVFGLTLGVVW